MKPRILYIEDQPEYFGPFITALRSAYELEQAGNLTHAVQILAGEDFDLIIVDIMLAKGERQFPDIDDRRSGLHLIRLLRGERDGGKLTLKCHQDVPIVALTAVSDASAHRDLEALGVRTITKPFLSREVLEQIAAMIAQVHHAR